MTAAWPHGDPRDVVRAIVADPRFRREPPVAAARRSWLDDVRDWLGHLLRGIFHRLDHALGTHSPFDTAIGFALIAGAFALLGYCIFVLVRAAGTTAGTRARRVPASVPAPFERSAAELRAAATRAATTGAYRAAAALLFLAGARALDERGWVAYDAARTPGEYRRLISDPLFDAFAADAVVAQFAAAEPHGDLFERMRGCYDRFFGPAGM